MNPPFSMKPDGLIDCYKCPLIRTSDWIDAINTETDFECVDSRSEYFFRTYSVATSLVTSLTLLLLCRADVHLWRIRSVHFLSKVGKTHPMKEENGWKICLLLARVGIFYFDIVIYKVLFPICTLTWRVHNYVSRQGKGIIRRNEKTKGHNFVTFL